MSQQHRHGYAAGLPRGLPGTALQYLPEVPAALTGSGTRCARPISARFEPVRLLKDVKRRFLAYSFPPRSPDPPHLAVLKRPGFVRAAPALPATTRIRLPSATATCCDRPQAKVSHLHTNQQRLTAQYKSDAHPVPIVQRETGLVLPLLAVGLSVHNRIALLTLLAVSLAAGICSRRFGPPGFLGGILGSMGTFLGFFIQDYVPLSDFGSLAAETLIGAIVFAVVHSVLFRPQAETAMRRMQRPYAARARALARVVAELHEATVRSNDLR